MNTLRKKIGHEKLITNEKGEVEAVVMPVSDYNYLIELLEDYGLGKAIEEAENEKVMNREEALRYLENA